MKKLILIITILVLCLSVKAQTEINSNIDKDMVNTSKAGSCGSPDGVMNYISGPPASWDDLDIGGYCYQGNQTTSVTTMVFTFVATSTSVLLNGGFSESCANNTFGGFQLYDALCNPLTTSLSPTGLIIGDTYIWSIDMRAWGGAGCNGYTTFCPYVISVTPLPIELTEFTVDKTNNYNVVKWQTASEHNSSHFILDRSTTIPFTENDVINMTAGAGNSTELLDYSFVDLSAPAVINYYQLTQVDCDGNFKQYGPIAIDNRPHKFIVTTINLLGQPVTEAYRGIVINIYDDGTSVKTLQSGI